MARTGQAPFVSGYISAALVLAFLAGFGIGAHMASIIGLGFPLHTGFQTYIQLHGHVQLLGWTGLFIIGISLHFVPRLTSQPIASPIWLKIILILIAGGLALRTVSHSFLPYATASVFYSHLAWLVAFSGVVETAGVVAYVLLLVSSMLLTGEKAGAVLRPVRPFFGMMLTGWLLYMALTLVLGIQMARLGGTVFLPAWNQFKVEVFIGLVVLPVALAFSIKTFPLYFRLAPVDWPVRWLALAYLLAVLVQLFGRLPLAGSSPAILPHLAAIAKAGVILFFVWKLDILTRAKPPWTSQQEVPAIPHRKQPRPEMPDYGEFGRFERLVYSAYAWLALGALFEIFFAVSGMLGQGGLHRDDLVRHAYLLGFATMLIFGMAVRMLPGFLRKKRIASPALVDATFWLGNAATITRVLPLLFTLPQFASLPLMIRLSEWAFALSGILGMAAVACLAVNLYRTARG